MSADIPNPIVPGGNDLAPTARLEAITTYLDKTIKDNIETMDALQTRLANVSRHYESSLPGHTRVEMGRLGMMGGDLGAISELVTRLSDGSIEKEEEEQRKRMVKNEKWKKMRAERKAEREKKLKEMKLKEMKPKYVQLKLENVGKVRRVKVEKVKQVKVEEKVEKVKVKEMVDSGENIAAAATTTTTTTAATLAGTQLPAPPAADLASSEHPIIPNCTFLPPVVMNTTTPHKFTKAELTKIFREILQRYQAQRMLALESAQDTLAPLPTAQEGGAVGLSGQTGLEAKEQVVGVGREPENEPQNENQNAVASSSTFITAPQAETQIPPLPTVNHTSPGHPAIATNPTPQPITVNETPVTTIEKIMKTPLSTTRQKALKAVRRQSGLITSSVKKSAQAMLAPAPPITLSSESPSPGPPSRKTTPVLESPILRPRPGAGITRRQTRSGAPSPEFRQSPPVKVERAQDNIQHEIQVVIPAAPAPAPAAPAARPRRGRAPAKVPQAPQRRSTRIMESAQKKEQARLPTIEPESPILEPKGGAGVSKRGGRGGGRGARGGRGRGARGARGG